MEIDIAPAAAQFSEKLKRIKLFLTDVDGVLTDGTVWWQGEEVGWNRTFNVYDGYGLKMMMRGGLQVGVISGGDSLGLKKRIDNLGIKISYLGNENKVGAFQKVCELTGLDPSEMFYIGDEPFDMPILKQVGFAATVPHAVNEVKEVCDYVTQRHAGQGCVREVAEMIRIAQGFTI